MPMETHSFKRLVLGLQPSASSRSMRLAVDFADLLHLDLLGLLIEDTSLSKLANIPFAREIRPLGGGWHSIDPEQVSREFELASRSVQRMFTKATRHLTTSYQFDIARGSPAESIAAISHADDIVMVAEPPSPGEHVTQQFTWLIQAAFRSAAAVVLVPRQIARTKGPIVAIAASPSDPSIRVAAAIAIAAKEDLIILDTCETTIENRSIRALAAELGLAIRHVVTGSTLRSHPTAFSPESLPLQERLAVVTRGAFRNGEASTIAAARRVPVLVIEPMQADQPSTSTETATV